jgi:hypothetical protein
VPLISRPTHCARQTLFSTPTPTQQGSSCDLWTIRYLEASLSDYPLTNVTSRENGNLSYTLQNLQNLQRGRKCWWYNWGYFYMYGWTELRKALKSSPQLVSLPGSEPGTYRISHNTYGFTERTQSHSLLSEWKTRCGRNGKQSFKILSRHQFQNLQRWILKLRTRRSCWNSPVYGIVIEDLCRI